MIDVKGLAGLFLFQENQYYRGRRAFFFLSVFFFFFPVELSVYLSREWLLAAWCASQSQPQPQPFQMKFRLLCHSAQRRALSSTLLPRDLMSPHYLITPTAAARSGRRRQAFPGACTAAAEHCSGPAPPFPGGRGRTSLSPSPPSGHLAASSSVRGCSLPWSVPATPA